MRFAPNAGLTHAFPIDSYCLQCPSDVVSLWVLEEEINGEIDRLVDLKTEVRRRIEAIPDERYRAILAAKYLNYQSLDRIADDMGYEQRQIFRLHGRALQAINMSVKVSIDF